MIVATAVLIFLLLIFTPIQFEIRGLCIFAELKAQIEIKVFCFQLAKEKLFVNSTGVGYQGTVDGYLHNDEESHKEGIDILKSITLHSAFLYFKKDLTNLNVNVMLLQNAILYTFSQIVCNLTHCQFACICDNFSNIDSLEFRIEGSVSVAELSSCFIKQGVRRCKHKLQKS